MLAHLLLIIIQIASILLLNYNILMNSQQDNMYDLSSLIDPSLPKKQKKKNYGKSQRYEVKDRDLFFEDEDAPINSPQGNDFMVSEKQEKQQNKRDSHKAIPKRIQGKRFKYQQNSELQQEKFKEDRDRKFQESSQAKKKNVLQFFSNQIYKYFEDQQFKNLSQKEIYFLQKLKERPHLKKFTKLFQKRGVIRSMLATLFRGNILWYRILTSKIRDIRFKMICKGTLNLFKGGLINGRLIRLSSSTPFDSNDNDISSQT